MSARKAMHCGTMIVTALVLRRKQPSILDKGAGWGDQPGEVPKRASAAPHPHAVDESVGRDGESGRQGGEHRRAKSPSRSPEALAIAFHPACSKAAASTAVRTTQDDKHIQRTRSRS